jgi:hypothetical protein
MILLLWRFFFQHRDTEVAELHREGAFRLGWPLCVLFYFESLSFHTCVCKPFASSLNSIFAEAMRKYEDTYQHKGLRKQLVNVLKEKGITDERVLDAINSHSAPLFP